MPAATTLSEAAKFIGKSLESLGTTIAVSIGILFIGLVIGKLVEKFLTGILKTLATDRQVKRVLGFNVPVEELLPALLAYAIYIITVILALDNLGIGVRIVNLVLWAVIILAMISFALSIRDLVPNVVNGIALLSNRRIKEGDELRIDNIKGYVQEITLTHITLFVRNGETVIIPNSMITKKIITARRRKAGAA